jgi:hypothetical protein
MVELLRSASRGHRRAPAARVNESPADAANTPYEIVFIDWQMQPWMVSLPPARLPASTAAPPLAMLTAWP